MAETVPPLECWGILVTDEGELGSRLFSVYLEPGHAVADSGALQVEGRFVEVVPFQVHRAPQWSSHHEPALEQTDADFDVPLDIPGP